MSHKSNSFFYFLRFAVVGFITIICIVSHFIRGNDCHMVYIKKLKPKIHYYFKCINMKILLHYIFTLFIAIIHSMKMKSLQDNNLALSN